MAMNKLLLLAIIAVAAIIMVVMWQGRQYQEFVAKAGKISGHLTRKEVRNFRQNQQTGKENWAMYTYQLADKVYAGEEKIEYADIWQKLNEGQNVEVYYNKDNPGESHLVVVLDRRLGVAEKLTGKVAK